MALNVRTRKLFGTIALVVSLVAYPWAGMAIYETFIQGLPRLVLLIYFVVAGLLWAVPAGIVIRWMSRPDPVE